MIVYAKPPKITLEEQTLLAMDATQRRKEKAERIHKILPPPFEFEDTGIRIKIVESQVIGDLLDLKIEAKKDGKLIDIDGHLRYFNPPLKVGNGTFVKKEDEFGNEYDEENMEYNPKEAIKQCIIQTIKGQLK